MTTRLSFGIGVVSLIGVGTVPLVVQVQPATPELERLRRHTADRIEQAFVAAALVPVSVPVMLPLLHKGDRMPIECANESPMKSQLHCSGSIVGLQPRLISEERGAASSILTRTLGLRMAGLPDDASAVSQHDKP